MQIGKNDTGVNMQIGKNDTGVCMKINNDISKMKNNKKGLIFTIDGIIALVLATIIITSTIFYVNNSEPKFTDLNLHRIALDSLTILEKDGTLADAALTNSSTILSEFLEALPVQYCGRIIIKDIHDDMMTNTTKSGCLPKDYRVVSRRVFVAKDIYYAEMVMWYD